MLLALRRHKFFEKEWMCIMAKTKVGVVMGSDSDFDTMKSALTTLKKFGIEFEVNILSAHRTPKQAEEYARGAKDKGLRVLICAAGKAAHLAGVMAGNTVLPVIGVPMKSSTLDGMDSLLSTVQMPSGIPVATVAIDGAANAALLAVQMLALSDETLFCKLEEYKKEMEEKVLLKNKEIQEKIKQL